MQHGIPEASAECAAFFGALINRRVTIRRPCGMSTSVAIAPERRSPFSKARVHDISQGGIALVLKHEVPVGETLFLQMTNSLRGFTYDLAAEVRHATAHTRGRWLIGLEFDRTLSLGELAALI
jgi:hypothetical protein